MAGDYISRQDAIEVVRGIDRYFVKYIEQLPAADVRENKVGIWKVETKYHEDDDQAFYYYYITCSECGERPQKSWDLPKYCPHCGARLGEDPAYQSMVGGN